MRLEIFGNSHAATLPGAPPCGHSVSKQRHRPYGRGYTDVHPKFPFRAWFLGPVLAYNFYEHHLPKVYSFIDEFSQTFGNKKEYTLLMQVGEIDCRVHLPKYVSDSRSVADVVEECVSRYHRSILDLKDKGFNVAVGGAQPSLCDETIIRRMPEEERKYNIAGTTKIRNEVCKHWDSFHGSLCKLNDIPFVSIYNDLTDENGMTKEDMFSDYIHLSHDKTIDFWINSIKKLNIL
jgi:hypothetical protein